jgi:benzoyl-CoA 2,3-dioxygenase component B
MGLKGRYQEARMDDDHILTNSQTLIPKVEGNKISTEESTLLTAINYKLREDYAKDSQRGISRFNKIIRNYAINTVLKLPDPAFNRNIGVFKDINCTPDGTILSQNEWQERRHEWLPSADDYAFVKSLMVPVIEPGKMASWIAPPKRGIHGLDIDYEYVIFH